MTPKLKNIIMFLVVAVCLVVIYLALFRGKGDEEALLSSSGEVATVATGSGGSSGITGSFLSLLLSVKGLSLNDAIISDPAFISLVDSSIELVPEGNEGRPNPFAPLGFDF
ncbi:MAG: hypothetical protein AAB500_01640 [Patescibacteria group bacterium]